MHYIFPKKFAKILYISEPISEKTAFCSITIKNQGIPHVSMPNALGVLLNRCMLMQIFFFRRHAAPDVTFLLIDLQNISYLFCQGRIDLL